MEKYPDSHIASYNLEQSRQMLFEETGKDPGYTPAAPGHYWGLYRWDQAFASIIDARHGTRDSLRAAKSGIMTLFRGQRDDGFVPNIQNLGPRRLIEPERIFGFESSDSSNYTQPPLEAQAVYEICNAIREQKNVDSDQANKEADEYMAGVYPKLKLAYEYFDKFRSNGSNDKLIGILHPHESGRDSGPEWDDIIKPFRLKRKGVDTPSIVDKANMVLDYVQVLAFGNKLKKAKGDIIKARETFWVNDVMTNCIYASNLRVMAKLAEYADEPEDPDEPTDVEKFTGLANAVEEQILTKMWFPEANDGQGMFYALNNDGQPIEKATISNLTPLLLSNLKEEQLESILKLIDKSFKTRYGLPSVATESIDYDPHYSEWDRLWRGPVWLNAVWLVAEGLATQINRPELAHRQDLMSGCRELLRHLSLSSRELVNQPDKRGPREFYNPITGKGQRRRVARFSWSNLAQVIPVEA